MEKIILAVMDWLRDIDFASIFRMMGVGLLLFWLVVIWWVISDTRERFASKWAQFVVVAIVVLLPLFGFLIYLIVRPRTTTEEDEMLDLERRYLKFEAAGLGDCPSCGLELMPNFVYCPRCGRELRVKCASCEIYLEPNWMVCPFCGNHREDVREEFMEEILPEESEDVETKNLTEEKPADPQREEPRKEKVKEDSNKADEAPEVMETVSKTEPEGDAQGNKRPSGKKKTIIAEADGFIKYVGRIPMQLIRRKRGTPRAAQKKSKDVSTPVKESGSN
jgi:hypothetical protein